jgi:hypothetical protein
MILPPGSRSGFSLSRTCNKQGVIVGSSRRGTKTTEFARLHCPFKSTTEGICPKESQKTLPGSA